MKFLLFAAVAQAYLQLDFERQTAQDVALAKRHTSNGVANAMDVPIEQIGDLMYTVQLHVGTPPQNVTVQLDTGSSDLWFPVASNPYCKRNAKLAPKKVKALPATGFATENDQVAKKLRTFDCDAFGLFNSSMSSSFKSNDSSEFFVKYEDGTYASGMWGTDTFKLNHHNVSNITVALANIANASMGVLGVGFPAEETTDDPSPGSLIDKEHYQYDNFPIALKRTRTIKKVSYSIFLNDTNSKKGVILFGGVDHSKYQGTLWTVPMVNNLLTLNQTTTSRPEITLNGLGFRDDKKNVTLWGEKIPVLLDTGTTLAYAPKQVVDVIAKRVNGTIDSKTGGIKLKKCPNAKDNSELIFNFAGAEIPVSLLNMVEKRKGKCYLEIRYHEELSKTGMLLGDIFMRHVYSVFNMEDMEVSFAVANGNDSAPLQIEAIISDVPSAVKAPQYYNTFASSNLPSTVTNDIFASTATASMEPPSSVLESLKSKSSSTSSIDTSVPSDDKKIIDDDHSGHDHAKRDAYSNTAGILQISTTLVLVAMTLLL